jgi:deazaflavin-dependent oxidoreductase (nitroreductase family)
LSRRTQRIRYFWQQCIGNRIGRLLLTLGIAPPVYALLETTGRKTGKPRRTPVGNGLVEGTSTFWLISEYGTQAAYVRNILANPRVRVKVRRRWHQGVAHVLADDDARVRQRCGRDSRDYETGRLRVDAEDVLAGLAPRSTPPSEGAAVSPLSEWASPPDSLDS